YYEVHGGDGKTKDGYQVVINFLNPEFPIISVEHNYITDTSGLTGTWCQFEVGEPITESEFKEAYRKAVEHPKVSIR
uniref:hypothetical protein n=1 Tax=Rufibacter sp. XAAS-G3-1 TaxID=2729134 RepID=UPI001C628A80